LQQMIDLGTKLRQELVGENDPIIDEQGRTLYPHILAPTNPYPMSHGIRVRSTNFVRTIQSVQGFLQGFLAVASDQTGGGKFQKNVTIDIRHTNWIIPDPQPRLTPEQAKLELELSQQPHLLEKERELLPFAIAMTKALQPMLAEDARDADFGVPQQELSMTSTSSGTTNEEVKPLSWNQLAEITKCLAIRNMLPEGISKADQETISQHAAYRWYESFRHPKLSYYAMNTLTRSIVKSLLLLANAASERSLLDVAAEPKMHIWSAHDSTLICLMCAFRLEQPAVWPEYASYLLIELLFDDQENEYVRFSLNGQVLRTLWDPQNPMEMIRALDLFANLESQGADITVTEERT
jgi:hypothetical protein